MIQLLYKTSEGMMDISDRTESITWSGSVQKSVRSLKLNIMIRQDNMIPLDIGDELSFFYNQSLLFSGRLFSIAEQREKSTFELVFHDPAVVLNKVKLTMKNKNISGENIIREMCKQLKLTPGRLAAAPKNKKLIAIEKTGRQILNEVYENQSETERSFVMPMFYDNALHIIEVGKDMTPSILLEGGNVITASYSKNGDCVINSVKVMTPEGKKVEVIRDEASIELVGEFQHTLVTGSKDYAYEAKKWLKRPIESIAVTAVGSEDYLSGYSVTIKNEAEEHSKVYVIESDRHEWTAKGYVSQLMLVEKEGIIGG